jgi:hypothetical protein
MEARAFASVTARSLKSDRAFSSGVVSRLVLETRSRVPVHGGKGIC